MGKSVLDLIPWRVVLILRIVPGATEEDLGGSGRGRGKIQGGGGGFFIQPSTITNTAAVDTGPLRSFEYKSFMLHSTQFNADGLSSVTKRLFAGLLVRAMRNVVDGPESLRTGAGFHR